MKNNILRSLWLGFAKAVSSAAGVLPGQSNGYNWLNAFLSKKNPTAEDLLDMYRDTIYACSNLNAQAVASAPMHLLVTTSKGQSKPRVPTRPISSKMYKHLMSDSVYAKRLAQADNVEEVMEHPMLDLLKRVNEFLDGYTLWELTDLYQEMTGNAYWYIPKDPILKIPTEIWILPSHLVTTTRQSQSSQMVTSYDYSTGQRVIRYRPEDVIPFRFPNLKDPYLDGWSPARAIYESAHLMDKWTAYQSAFFDNMARPDVLISMKEGSDPDSRDRIEKKYNQKFGKDRVGGVLVIDDDVEVTPVQYPPKDIQMLQLHGVSKVDIANAYAVPMSLLDSKDVNRANAEAGHYQHAKLAILPRLKRRDERINRHLCPLYDERLFVMSDNPVPEDIASKLEARKVNLTLDVTTVNEERAEDGRSPVPWGDGPASDRKQPPVAPEGQEDPEDDPTGGKPPKPPKSPKEEDDAQDAKKTLDVLVSYALKEIDRKSAINQLVALGASLKSAVKWTEDVQPDVSDLQCKCCGSAKEHVAKMTEEGGKLEQTLRKFFRGSTSGSSSVTV